MNKEESKQSIIKKPKFDHKKYYQENKEKFKRNCSDWTCEACNITIKRYNKCKHVQTHRHKRNIGEDHNTLRASIAEVKKMRDELIQLKLKIQSE